MPEEKKEGPETIPPKKGMTRREILKMGVAAAAVATGGYLLSRIPIPKEERIPQPEITPFESRIGRLIENVNKSSLRDISSKEVWPEQSLVEFLNASKRAEVNFEQLEKQPEVAKIRQIVRQKFSNPDIETDEQIFFLRDRKIVHEALDALEQLPWETMEKTALNNRLKEILETSNYPITSRELFAGPYKRRLTPKNIVSNYEKIGTKRNGKIEIVTGVETQNEKTVARAQELTQKISKLLSSLPLPNLAVRVVVWDKWTEKEPVSGSFAYWPWAGGFPTIDYHFKSQPGLGVFGPERETLFILHEAGHALDIGANPTLLQFLTPGQISRLTLLREEATMESFSPQVEDLLRNKKLRGKNIWAMTGNIGNEVENRIDRQSWFLSRSGQSEITQEEFNLLVRIYPESSWLWLFALLRPWYKNFQQRFYKAVAEQGETISVSSWEEVLVKQQNLFDELSKEDPVFAHGLKLLKPKINALNVENLKGSPWHYPFVKAIETALAEDFIKGGTSKKIFGEQLYKAILQEFLIDYRSAEREGLAEGIAFALFLKAEREQNPDKLNSKYWEYFNQLRKFIKTPKIRVVE